MKKNSDEYWIALRTFAEDLDVDLRRNDFRIQDLYIAGTGRVFLRDWAARDAVDAEVYDGQMTTGYRWAETDPVRKLMAKWRDRSRLYLAEHSDALRDIQDWLYESASNHAPWIKHVDYLGRPKKLMKCGSIEALLHEARKHERTRGQARLRQPSALTLGIADECFAVDAGAGHTVVRLASPAALDVESDRMHHCIGRGFYDDRVERPHAYRYFSIRDPNGHPVATVEVRRAAEGDEWLLVQFRGPSNAEPEAHVAELWAGVMRQLDIREQTDADVSVVELPPLHLGRW